jgi:hypothetical protein
VVEFVLFKIMVRKNWRTAKDIGASRGLSIAISDINQSSRPEVNNHVGTYVSWADGHKKCELISRTGLGVIINTQSHYGSSFCRRRPFVACARPKGRKI